VAPVRLRLRVHLRVAVLPRRSTPGRTSPLSPWRVQARYASRAHPPSASRWDARDSPPGSRATRSAARHRAFPRRRCRSRCCAGGTRIDRSRSGARCCPDSP
jgi:hypothetical protein